MTQISCFNCKSFKLYLIDAGKTEQGFLLSLFCDTCGMMSQLPLDNEAQAPAETIQKDKPAPTYAG